MQVDIEANSPELMHKDQYRLFETKDLDEARAKVAEVYCDHKLASNTGQVDAFHYHMPFADMSFNYMQYGAESKIEPGHLGDFYLIQLPVTGKARIEVDGEVVESNSKRASVINPSAYTKMVWGEGCKQFLVQISKQKVENIAASLTGLPTNKPLIFDSAMNNSDPMHAAWWRHLFNFATEYSQDHSIYHNQDILDNELDTIIKGLLRSLNSNYSEQLLSDRRTVLPRHVKLAVDYIHEHASENFSVDTLVALTGVSERQLYEGFKKFQNISPMRFLLQIRLRNVRSTLETSCPEQTSVTEVAINHGFTQLGRFSALYKKVYGELPSKTLSR